MLLFKDGDVERCWEIGTAVQAHRKYYLLKLKALNIYETGNAQKNLYLIQKHGICIITYI